MFLYRPEYYLPSEKAAEQGLVGACEVVMAKQRNGPRTTVPLNFEERYTRFESHRRQPRGGSIIGGAFPAGALGPVAC